MTTTAARRAWEALNDRQRTWLTTIYEADQEAERLAKGAWGRGERPKPASKWRWIEYGITDSPLSSGPSGSLQSALSKKKVWDQGAGTTLTVLTQAGLIETRRDPDGLGTLLWIQLTKAGRAAARAGGADDAAPSRRRPKGLLSETLWKMLVEVWCAGENGLKRRWTDGAWEVLIKRDLITVTTKTMMDNRITVSDTGAEHYRDHWADYARMYPAINAPHPDPQTTPVWPKQADQHLNKLAGACRRIGSNLRTVNEALSPVEPPPKPGAEPTPEWAEAAVLAQEQFDLQQQQQNMLALHRDQLAELYRQAVARYAAVAAAVVTATSDGDDPTTVLATKPVNLDDRGLAPTLPCPKTGLDGLDRDIATAHNAAVKGSKRPRSRHERRWEALDSPGGRDLAAVLAYASHLHTLAAQGQLTRLLLRRNDD